MKQEGSNNSKPFLFILEHNSNEAPRAKRHAVYQHVQLRYTRWKRNEDTKKMRASVRFPLRPTENKSSHPRDQLGQAYETRVENQPRFGPGQVIRATEELENQLELEEKPSPVTVLQEGNSDPFSVFPVTMNPENNALMAFTREYYLPGIQADVHRPGQKAVGSEWAACVSFLEDEGLAYSHFSRIAVLLKRGAEGTTSEAEMDSAVLKFKTLSMSLLRKRLKEGLQDPRTHNQILLLLNADLFEQNMPAAKAHAAAIALLLQNGIIKVDLMFVFKVLYHDCQRAAMSLSKPSFDLEGWIPAQFAPVMEIVERRMPPGLDQRVFPCAIDPVLTIDEPVTEAIALLRHAAAITYLAFQDKSFFDMQMILYGRYACTICMGRLINAYLDARVLLKADRSGGTWDEPLSMCACLRTVACLSVLIWLRRQARIDDVKITNDVAIFSANELILERLKDTLIESKKRSPPHILRKYANVRLWGLFAGAQYEQVRAVRPRKSGDWRPTGRSKTEVQDARQNWFTAELAATARAMHLYEWVDVRQVLSGFLFSQAIETNEAEWFAKAMEANRAASTE